MAKSVSAGQRTEAFFKAEAINVRVGDKVDGQAPTRLQLLERRQAAANAKDSNYTGPIVRIGD
ncbi:MAG: hypothetical protein SFU25_08110 [Candidatus Caenarcaniphilales bacterium]|nr:hypothetical protein [Candidatus Caenarcaniphilales bacterium]